LLAFIDEFSKTMQIPGNIIANADDLGFNDSVNQAILYCFKSGYINSTSLMTNTPHFGATVELIKNNPEIGNIGLHVDLAQFRPVTDFRANFLDKDGNWDVWKTKKLLVSLSSEDKKAFAKEINAQIERAIDQDIKLVHLDAHLHLHTSPGFFNFFLAAAIKYNLKLRLAQTFNEGSYLKYYYRKFINGQIKKNGCNYSERFETVSRYLQYNSNESKISTEIMLHPDLDQNGKLTDHFDDETIRSWLRFLLGDQAAGSN